MAADDTSADMPVMRRHVYGPRPVSALLPGLTRAAFRKRAPAATQVLADWPAIVGPALARVTAPRRVQGGTLTIGCSGPIATELQHLSAELLARINAALGGAVIERLRFLHDPAVAASVPALPPPPPREVLVVIEGAVTDVPNGELRDALSRLGQALATELPHAFQTPKRPPCD